MAKKNSAVLWTVEQTLGDSDATKKTNKERARHNVGINFEPTAGEPPTPDGNTLSFVDKIDEADDGTLTYTRKNVTVDGSITSTGKNPVSGKAVSDKISGLNYNDSAVAKKFVTEVDETAGVISVTRRQPEISDVKDLQTALNDTLPYFVTLSTPFSDVEEAYTAGRLVLLVITDVISANDPSSAIGNPSDTVFTNKSYYILSKTHKTDDTLDQINFTRLADNSKIKGYYGGLNVDHVYFTNYLECDYYYCDKSLGWKHYTPPNGTTGAKKDFGLLRFAGVDYVDYHASVYMQEADVNTDTGDALLITDKNNFGKIVRSHLAFNQSATDAYSMFLSKYGDWAPALPTYSETSQPSSIDWDNFTDTKFYAITNSPLAGTGNSPESGNMFTLSGHIDRGSNNSYNVQLAMGDKLYYRHTTGTGSAWSDWITLNEYSAGIDLKLTGTTFSVNTTSSIDTYSAARESFAIGNECSIEYANASFIGGNQSSLYGGINTFVFGLMNNVGNPPADSDNPTYTTFKNSTVIGYYNYLRSSDNNFILGLGNSISDSPDNTEVSTAHGNNLAIGISNNIQGGKCNTVLGYNNVIPYQTIGQHSACASYINMIGHHLLWNNFNQNDMLILGRYNDTSFTYSYDGTTGHPIRITGCGAYDISTDTTTRINIEELYPHGKLWLRSSVETSKITINTSDDSTTIYNNEMFINPTNGVGGIHSVINRSVHVDSIPGGLSEHNKTYTQMTIITPTSFGLSDVYDPNDKISNNETIYQAGFTRVLNGAADKYDLDSSTNMPTRAIDLEFAATYLGGAGISLTKPAVPSWNTNIINDLELSWLRIHGNRRTATTLPWEALAGNLEVGKLAVKLFSEDQLTQDHPLIPGEKEGDLTFITGNGNSAVTHSFWVQDGSHGGLPYEVSNYITANTFCILATLTPSVFNKETGAPITLGAFTAFYR